VSADSPLAHALVWVPVALVVAVAMDLWAALLHGKVWHGWLWAIHRSHHAPQPEGGLEANDALSLLHAPLAIALIVVGCVAAPTVARELAFGTGVGMSAFGLGYLVVHDGLCHGRLPVGFLLRLRVFRGIVRAHRVHHTGTSGGAPFGFFFGVRELERRARARAPRLAASPTKERARDAEAPATGGPHAEPPRDLAPDGGVPRRGAPEKLHDAAR
jgi:beta-carotene 3-hydroxylase